MAVEEEMLLLLLLPAGGPLPSEATGGAGAGLANLTAARQQPLCCLGRMACAPVLRDALPKPGTRSKAFIPCLLKYGQG